MMQPSSSKPATPLSVQNVDFKDADAVKKLVESLVTELATVQNGLGQLQHPQHGADIPRRPANYFVAFPSLPSASSSASASSQSQSQLVNLSAIGNAGRVRMQVFNGKRTEIR